VQAYDTNQDGDQSSLTGDNCMANMVDLGVRSAEALLDNVKLRSHGDRFQKVPWLRHDLVGQEPDPSRAPMGALRNLVAFRGTSKLRCAT